MKCPGWAVLAFCLSLVQCASAAEGPASQAYAHVTQFRNRASQRTEHGATNSPDDLRRARDAMREGEA